MFTRIEIGRIAGIPIYLDMMFVLVLIVFTYPYFTAGNTQLMSAGFIIIVGLLLSILLHELGHAFAGRLFNARVSHIELTGLGGVAHFERSLPRSAFARSVIYLAGPAVNWLLWQGLGRLAGEAAAAAIRWWRCRWRCWPSAILSAECFNLLPAYPLDGGHTLDAWLGRAARGPVGNAHRRRPRPGRGRRPGLSRAAERHLHLLVALFLAQANWQALQSVGRWQSVNGLRCPPAATSPRPTSFALAAKNALIAACGSPVCVGVRQGVDAGVDALLHRDALPAVHQGLLRAHGLRAWRGRSRRASVDGGVELLCRHQLLRRSPWRGLGGGEHAPVSSISRVLPQPIRPGSSAASMTEGMPMCTSGMPNARVVGGHPHVAARRHLEPAAEAEAVDAPDDGHRTVADRLAGLMQPRDEQARAVGASAAELVQVGAADKGALARAGQHDRAQRRVGAKASKACLSSRISGVDRQLSRRWLSTATRPIGRPRRSSIFTCTVASGIASPLVKRAPVWQIRHAAPEPRHARARSSPRPQRGRMMGNRGGAFHAADRTLGTRRWATRQWIAACWSSRAGIARSCRPTGIPSCSSWTRRRRWLPATSLLRVPLERRGPLRRALGGNAWQRRARASPGDG